MTIKCPTREDIPGLRRLWQQAFGDGDAYLDAFFSTGFSPERCLFAGDAQAACYWLDCSCRGQKIAYLYAVATAEDRRGQGLCRALMSRVKEVLREQGYAGILLVPGSEALRAMYRKLGFCNATTLREFSATALPSPEAPCLAEANSLRPLRGHLPQRGRQMAPSLRELSAMPTEGVEEILQSLSAEAYAQARQALLPEGAAIEGPEFFRFLATQASFYRFGDAIFVCIREQDHLFIPELLGDEGCICQILTALGCTHATARTPGPGTDWAMYCPLTPGTAPTHFSLALD